MGGQDENPDFLRQQPEVQWYDFTLYWSLNSLDQWSKIVSHLIINNSKKTKKPHNRVNIKMYWLKK